MSQSGANLLVILHEVLQFLLLFLRILVESCKILVTKFLPTQLKDVSGDVVLVTGAGHGIGKEIALQYAALGSTVICVDVNEKNNNETVKLAKQNANQNVHGFICDVTSREKVLKLAENIKATIGPISVLVNNAGIMPTHPLEQHTVEEIHKVFNVNVFSHFWTIAAFLPHMKEQNRGHIVCMSSAAGLIGLANLVPYCATKFAVRGMMEGLHDELRQGPYKNKINTTLIYPYMTNTGLCKHPKVKFPLLLGLLEPKVVASHVIQAQRTNTLEVSIPKVLLDMNHATRLLPHVCALMVKDYIDSGVESDLLD